MTCWSESERRHSLSQKLLQSLPNGKQNDLLSPCLNQDRLEALSDLGMGAPSSTARKSGLVRHGLEGGRLAHTS